MPFSLATTTFIMERNSQRFVILSGSESNGNIDGYQRIDMSPPPLQYPRLCHHRIPDDLANAHVAPFPCSRPSCVSVVMHLPQTACADSHTHSHHVICVSHCLLKKGVGRAQIAVGRP
jgi:hypothetical protein